MYIPHSGRSARRVEVPLNEDSSCLGALGADNHVRPFNLTGLTGVAYPDDRLRTVHVVEEAAAGHDDGEGLSDEFRAQWDVERAGDLVRARIEKDDLTRGSGSIDDILQSGGVVGIAVASSPSASHTTEGRCCEVIVSWLRSLVVFASGL